MSKGVADVVESHAYKQLGSAYVNYVLAYLGSKHIEFVAPKIEIRQCDGSDAVRGLETARVCAYSQ